MTSGTFYHTLAGMGAAVVVAIVAVHFLGRWHDRQDRETAMAGVAPPPWHPETGWDTRLDLWEQDVLDGIEAGWDSAGLAILDGEGEQ